MSLTGEGIFATVRATGLARPAETLTARDLADTRLFGTAQCVPTLAEVIIFSDYLPAV